tara:strand:- start:7310 stop:8137 length:828 start_codon:yes stop_codon:yes gene_type:complete
MKAKHNKKRNTAFVYEALIKEATYAILKNDEQKSHKVVGLIKKHFTADSFLKKDLECYRSLYENQGIDKEISEKILKESALAKRMIDPDGLFGEQTAMINDVNKTISPSVFNNFVPNYKTLATISKMFNTNSPKEKVILENRIIENMSNIVEESENNQEIDNVVYTTFVQKFNEKYSDVLLSEQKELLTRYISSFADNSIELKLFLNEEIGRLKSKLEESETTIEGDDDVIVEKTKQVVGLLESYSTETDAQKVIMTVLKTQQLVKELYDNGSES